MTITGICITLQVIGISDKYAPVELRIVTETGDGEKHTVLKLIREDDLRARFDWLWNILGRDLKEYLKQKYPEPEITELP